MAYFEDEIKKIVRKEKIENYVAKAIQILLIGFLFLTVIDSEISTTKLFWVVLVQTVFIVYRLDKLEKLVIHINNK